MEMFMDRFRSGIRKMVLYCLALALCLSVISCDGRKKPQADKTQTNDSAAEGTQQAESAPETGFGTVLASYGVEAPVSRPAIYVNMAGYVSGREKKVVFAGGQHGKTFRVVRSQDGAVVYTGRIPEETMDDMTGQQFSVADFTALEEPGLYYVHTDIIGQSYPFRIAPDAYENLFLSMLRNASDVAMEESAQGICEAAFGMHVIMYALQCNGTLFESAYEHLGEDEQDKQLVTQLLYVGKWMISQQHQDGSLYDDYAATAAFCGIMEMSRHVFGRYEASVDKEYKEAAMRAWEWLAGMECHTDAEKSARFYAAAQLFHEEGSEQYKKIAEAFLKEKEADYFDGQFVFYGVLAYISAEKGTDRDLCTYIMQDLMDRTEGICEAAKEDTVFGVGSRAVEDSVNHALHLSFINYLTPSKEYTQIIENTIQYMGGLNESGTCYVGADGRWKNTDVVQGANLEWNGIMLLGMSDLLKNLSGYSPDTELISE